jgi:hypothetical protein
MFLKVLNCGVFNMTWKMTKLAMEKTEFTLEKKSTHISVAGQDNACVFHRSQGDSTL